MNVFSTLSNKTFLSIAGSLAGAGGMLGLSWGGPTIMWKTGISCKTVGVEVPDESDLTPGRRYFKFKGGFTSVAEAEKGGRGSCYKK